jgi:hypothetical protein
MLKKGFASSAALIALLGTTATAISQDPPRSGMYQIQSGVYREDGGIWGTIICPLPGSLDAFVSLMIDPGMGAAELTFLDNSQQAVFSRLTNGTVSGDTIQFHYATVHPAIQGWPAWVDYTVTNAAGHLWISGSITSSPPCCDIPYWFEHRDVRAAFMPVLSIRAASEIELRWSSASNQNYQVQYQTDLTQPVWTNLGGPVQGNGTTNNVVDSMAPANLQRFYRILTSP